MQTTVSTKGLLVLPGRARRKLGNQAGDAMEVSVEAGRIVLMPHRKKAQKARALTDPITKLPVLIAGKGAPVLRSRDVEEILADF